MRKICGLLLSLLVSSTTFAALAPSAGASAATDASQFISLTNQVRAQHGLVALRVDSTLTSVAQRWSDHMAAAGTISRETAHLKNRRTRFTRALSVDRARPAFAISCWTARRALGPKAAASVCPYSASSWAIASRQFSASPVGRLSGWR